MRTTDAKKVIKNKEVERMEMREDATSSDDVP